jgi:phosphatidylglycerophosphate synthase
MIRLIFVNCLTGLRVLLVPFFLLSEANKNYKLSFTLVTVMFISDIADGFFARSLNSVSRGGAIFDSIADFFVVISLSVTFFLEKALPPVIPIMVILSFAVYSINCILNRSIVYTRLGLASGFLCMLSFAAFCGFRVFFLHSTVTAGIAITYLCVIYLGLSAIENCLIILKRFSKVGKN